MEYNRAPENTGLPLPWEDEPITRAQWEANRAVLMNAAVGYGFRPEGWWLYERNMPAPQGWRQARFLYAMGEFKGAELERVIAMFRSYYDAALDCARYGGAAREKYWRWEDIPPVLIEQWDAESGESRHEDESSALGSRISHHRVADPKVTARRV
jgi:hypothetical protein